MLNWLYLSPFWELWCLLSVKRLSLSRDLGQLLASGLLGQLLMLKVLLITDHLDPGLLHRTAQQQYPGKTIQAEQENNSKAVHGAARSRQCVRTNVFCGFWVTKNWFLKPGQIMYSADCMLYISSGLAGKLEPVSGQPLTGCLFVCWLKIKLDKQDQSIIPGQHSLNEVLIILGLLL